MQVRFDTEFSPESLLGNSTTGLVLIDDKGSISLFNRQAARLLGLAPERTIGSEFSSVVSGSDVEPWLKSPQGQDRLSVSVDGRPLDFGMSTGTLEDRRFRIVTIRDATRRRALESRAQSYELGIDEAQADWSVRLRASSILQFLRDYAAEPTSLAGTWDTVRRTGAVLFPLGGAVCVLANGQYRVQSSWGALSDMPAFPEYACTSDSGSPSATCPHFPAGVGGICSVIENGRVVVAKPSETGLHDETAALFAETIDFAVANARAAG